jgi:hypothetical protein
MKNLEEQLNNLKHVSFDEEEKARLRQTLVSYMEENPSVVRNSQHTRLSLYRESFINFINIKPKFMTIAIIIALLLGGGGASFAAENALPGDVLYPVKIHVNENIQELTAVSNEAEARVQAKIAERRLREAEKLAIKGKLDSKISAELNADFKEHSEKAKGSRIKAKEGNRTETDSSINSDTEITLGIHERLLEDIGETKPEMKEFIGDILKSVQAQVKETGDERTEIETKAFNGAGSDEKSAADGALKAAQNKIDEVKKFIEARKEKLSASVQLEFDARLKAANAAVAEGKVKTEAGAYADAFILFKKAAREAQTAKLIATTADTLGVTTEQRIRIEEKEDPNYWTEEKMRNAQPVENTRLVPIGSETKLNIDTDIESGGTSGSGSAEVQLGL